MILRDKNVLVTGGVKGIGKALVKKLLHKGARVGVFDTDVDGLNTLKSQSTNPSCFTCDVTNYQHVETAVNQLYEEFQKIDVLVNNAGMLYSAPLISITPEGLKKHDIPQWEKVISTDLSSVFYVTVNVVEKMIRTRTKGVIVNISSVSASGNAGQSAYSAAKAGVNALTATWAKELAPLGIRVVAVAPGYTDTESTHQAINESILKQIVKEVPLRRLANVEEIAEGILSVMTNDFFHGKVFELDGGLVI